MSKPAPVCELSSLITAATNPHEMPVATPSVAALRAGDGAAPRRMGVNATTVATRGQSEGGDPREPPRGGRAWRWPPEGLAVKRKTPSPAAMAAAANQSWRATAARPDHGHVGEHEEQLGGEDGLHEGEVAVMQRRDLEDEAQDHAADAGHPDGLAHQVEQQSGAEALTPGGGGGSQALAHRGRGRAEARGERQHHRPHHEPSP